MEEEVKVNKLELASELAICATYNNLIGFGAITTEEEMYDGENLTEDAQELFNGFYEVYLGIIEQNAIS
jgi:hypothetical protein